ncbi:MAG TPA: LptF/LptG family permease [Phycisphaerae bacterium]|nr:LptF/LptG family permease [Phycisphaerae bacterium]
MTTLHGYILRDLLKAFLLTQIALTALFTVITGGGLWVRYEGVSSVDALTFMPLVVPIVLTFTMPVAALFATTLVYGRLAADNEWLACRAAGLNVHRLFLSAMLLAVFVTVFTLLAGNYFIPGLVRELTWSLQSNVRDFAFQQLRNKGHIRQQQRFFLTAEGVYGVPRDQLEQRGFPTGSGFSYILVEGPTFLQLGPGGDVERFTVAQSGLCQFDATGRDVRVSLWVSQARDFTPASVVNVSGQKIGTITFPIPLPNKPAWQDLETLRRWRVEPWHGDKITEATRAFIDELAVSRVYAECRRQLAEGALELSDGQSRRFRVSAGEVRVARGDRPLLHEARVEERDVSGRLLRRLEAPRANITAHPVPNGPPLIEVELAAQGERRLLEIDPAGGGRVTRDRPLTIDAVTPEALRRELGAFTPRAVFDERVELPLAGELADKRLGLLASGEAFRRKIDAQIQFRLGFASSALVTVLMGAVLGVMFRGSQALAAFALACVPFGIVLILMFMGRQLCENRGTELAGLIVTWGGLAGVALADLALMRIGVPR